MMTAVQEIDLAIDQFSEDALTGGRLDLMTQKAQKEFQQGKMPPLFKI